MSEPAEDLPEEREQDAEEYVPADAQPTDEQITRWIAEARAEGIAEGEARGAERAAKRTGAVPVTATSERPMAHSHAWFQPGAATYDRHNRREVAYEHGQRPSGNASWGDVVWELLRVVAERDAAEQLVAQGVVDRVQLHDLAEQRGIERDAALAEVDRLRAELAATLHAAVAARVRAGEFG